MNLWVDENSLNILFTFKNDCKFPSADVEDILQSLWDRGSNMNVAVNRAPSR